MSFIKILLRTLFIVIFTASCSTKLEKLEINFKKDFSGTAKAKIFIKKDSNEVEEWQKISYACDFHLREIYGYDKKFNAEYKFDSYKTLMDAPECSKVSQHHISFEPLDIKDGILTKDVTLEMTLLPAEEFTISVPGEIIDVVGVSYRYYEMKANKSKVVFDIKSVFEKFNSKRRPLQDRPTFTLKTIFSNF